MSNVGKFVIDWWIGSPIAYEVIKETPKTLVIDEVRKNKNFSYVRTIRKADNPIVVDTLKEATRRIKAIKPIEKELEDLKATHNAKVNELVKRRNATLRGFDF